MGHGPAPAEAAKTRVANRLKRDPTSARRSQPPSAARLAQAANMSEVVDHPEQYGGADNPYETIKVVEAWQLGFHLGNVLRYIALAGEKGDALEALKKARWYLDRYIDNLENTRP
jgi:Protein of unknwon function (DUF3310)